MLSLRITLLGRLEFNFKSYKGTLKILASNVGDDSVSNISIIYAECQGHKSSRIHDENVT